jgi:ribulose-5-phosphate 4-epimerase/fuculose-1-phosphate aldolase
MASMELVPYHQTAEDAKTKALLCELCRQFYTLGWVTGTGGSISIKSSECVQSKMRAQQPRGLSFYLHSIRTP